MKRLTTNKPVEEMGLYELAHNCMFAKDGEAWHRDFDREISLRNMMREIYKAYFKDYDEQLDDDEILDTMFLENLQDPEEDLMGLISVFNMLAWSNADLRERLKHYEDLEEQGRLIELPCKPGDTVYEIIEDEIPGYHAYIGKYEVQDVSAKAVKYCDDWVEYNYANLYFSEQEAKEALERMKKED